MLKIGIEVKMDKLNEHQTAEFTAKSLKGWPYKIIHTLSHWPIFKYPTFYLPSLVCDLMSTQVTTLTRCQIEDGLLQI